MTGRNGTTAPRLETIRYWWHLYNDAEFNGKMEEPKFGLTRSKATDGYYEHYDHIAKEKLVIAYRCFKDEDHLCGTILHEMIHQYQHKVLSRKCTHDAVFTSIARRMERKYKFTVR